MRIRFLQDYQVKDAGGREFKKGQIYDLAPDSARHFLSRRRAEAVSIEFPAPQIKDAAEPPVSSSIPPKENATASEAADTGEKSEWSRTHPPEEKIMGGQGDPVKTFTEGQRNYRKRKLSGKED
jgi:hypothetical protein